MMECAVLHRALDRAEALLAADRTPKPLSSFLMLKDLAETSVLERQAGGTILAAGRHKLREVILDRQDSYNERLLAYLRFQLIQSDSERMSRTPKRRRLLYLAPFDALSVNGGTARIFGLSRALATDYDIDILSVVGPMRSPEVIPYASGITIYCAPLSPEYVARTAEDAKRFGDAAAPLGLARHLEHLRVLGYWFRRLAKRADICIMNQPYLVDLWMRDGAATRLVYDVPEVNSFFTKRLAASAPAMAEVVELQARLERDTCERADVIGMCSPSDCARLEDEQGQRVAGKLELIPNGVWVDESTFMPPCEARQLQDCCGLSCPLGVFMGIPSYPPNVAAVRFIASDIAPRQPECLFAIIGMDARGAGLVNTPPNMVFLGRISESRKDALLAMADFCLAPIAGYDSGSSLKVADYIAHGKPVIATNAGRRGYEMLGDLLPEHKLEAVPAAVERLLAMLRSDRGSMDSIALNARDCLREHYDWSVIGRGYHRRFERLVS